MVHLWVSTVLPEIIGHDLRLNLSFVKPNRVARSGASRPGTLCLHLISPPFYPHFTPIFLPFKKVLFSSTK